MSTIFTIQYIEDSSSEEFKQLMRMVKRKHPVEYFFCFIFNIF